MCNIPPIPPSIHTSINTSTVIRVTNNTYIVSVYFIVLGDPLFYNNGKYKNNNCNYYVEEINNDYLICDSLLLLLWLLDLLVG